jgi:hypothetical protein
MDGHDNLSHGFVTQYFSFLNSSLSLHCGDKADKPEKVSVSAMDISSGLSLYRPEATDARRSASGHQTFVIVKDFEGFCFYTPIKLQYNLTLQ